MERALVLAMLVVSCMAFDLSHVKPDMHKKRKLLQHPAVTPIQSFAPQSTTPATLPDLPDLMNKLALTRLETLMAANMILPLLYTPGPFIVFCPTNDALDDHDDRDHPFPEMSARVLNYHIVHSNIIPTDQIEDEDVIYSIEGLPIRFNKYDNGAMTAQCSPADMTRVAQKASNGGINVITRVMTPPTGNLMQALRERPGFATLLFTCIRDAELYERLSSPGPFTLFAPTDEAFSKLSSDTMDKLANNSSAMAEVLKYHVVNHTHCKAGLTTSTLATHNGLDISIKVTDQGSVEVNDGHVVFADVTVTNGVMHAIDTVLLPPDTIT